MKTTTVDATTNATRSIFARYGLPNQIVSGNGPPFQSAEYQAFLQQNGTQRILVSPYHPSSNGLAERFVQTFKYALESSASDPSCSLQQRICNFLLSYRSTPHATTGSSAAKPFLQRELRTRLSQVTRCHQSCARSAKCTMTSMRSSGKRLWVTLSLLGTTCLVRSGNLE